VRFKKLTKVTTFRSSTTGTGTGFFKVFMSLHRLANLHTLALSNNPLSHFQIRPLPALTELRTLHLRYLQLHSFSRLISPQTSGTQVLRTGTVFPLMLLLSVKDLGPGPVSGFGSRNNSFQIPDSIVELMRSCPQFFLYTPVQLHNI
jgi:hypothetical protein